MAPVRGRGRAEQGERGEQGAVERSAAEAAGGRGEEAGGAVCGVFGGEAVGRSGGVGWEPVGEDG